MAQDEMLLSDRRVEYSFDQGYMNDEEKKPSIYPTARVSKENTYNPETNNAMFGNSESNFNFLGLGATNMEFPEASPLTEKGAPLQTLFEKQRINMSGSSTKEHNRPVS